MDKKIVRLVGMFLFLGSLVCSLYGAEKHIYNTWQGGIIGKEADWNTPGNWSTGKVPTKNDGCWIKITGGGYEPVIKGKAEVNGKIVLGAWDRKASSARLTIREGSTLDLYGDDGFISNLSGTVEIEKGVVITFHPDTDIWKGGIYTRGSFSAQGTKDKPIIIQGTDEKHRFNCAMHTITSIPEIPNSCVMNYVQARYAFYGLLRISTLPNQEYSITNCSSDATGAFGAQIITKDKEGIVNMNNCSFAKPIHIGNIWKKGGQIYPHSKLELYNCTLPEKRPFVGFEGLTDGWIISHNHNGIANSYLIWTGSEGMNLIFDEKGHSNPDEEDRVQVIAGTVQINKDCAVKRLVVGMEAKLIINKGVTVKVKENLTNYGTLENNGKVEGELIDKREENDRQKEENESKEGSILSIFGASFCQHLRYW